MALGPLWRLKFSLESRSSFNDGNDYRWNLSLERKFDLVIAREKAPGSISGKLTALAPAKLPNKPIVSVSGVQIQAQGDSYKLDGLPLGPHPVYLVNALDSTLEKTLPPSNIELSSSEPKKSHTIEVVAASSLTGHIEALVLDSSPGPGKADFKESKWSSKPLDNFTLMAKDEGTGQVVKCKSDAKGRFRFSHLRPGKWKLELELDNAWMREQRLEILPYQTNFELAPCSREHIVIQLKEKQKNWKSL